MHKLYKARHGTYLVSQLFRYLSSNKKVTSAQEFKATISNTVKWALRKKKVLEPGRHGGLCLHPEHRISRSYLRVRCQPGLHS